MHAPAPIRKAVTSEVERAGRLIDTGLYSFERA
jgi:hypothetical protein